jgi:hypothetical protein
MPRELVDIEKVIRDIFDCADRKTWFSNGAHFQWLRAIENAGTSLYRIPGCQKA